MDIGDQERIIVVEPLEMPDPPEAPIEPEPETEPAEPSP